MSQASTSCCQSPVTVRDNLCHVETTGSLQSFQAIYSEDSDKLREGTRVDQSANERSAGKDNSIWKHSPWHKKFHTLVHSEPQYCSWFIGHWGESGTSRVSSLPQHVHRTHGEVNGPSNAQAGKQSISRDVRLQARCNLANHLQWQVLPPEDRGRDPQRFGMVRGVWPSSSRFASIKRGIV